MTDYSHTSQVNQHDDACPYCGSRPDPNYADGPLDEHGSPVSRWTCCTYVDSVDGWERSPECRALSRSAEEATR